MKVLNAHAHVTWIEKSKLIDIPAGVKFPQVIPDFVIELRSRSVPFGKSDTDRMPKLREKMEEYRAAGVRLGLLIDPKSKQVEIYRFGQEPSVLESPVSLVENLPSLRDATRTAIDCSEVMPDFILNVSEIW